MSFDDMMKELQRSYIANISKKIADIEKFFGDNDVKSLENEFHKIKGTGKTYGVPELSILGKVMEQACKDNKNISEIIPNSIVLLKKIEEARNQDQEFKIEADDIYKTVTLLAA